MKLGELIDFCGNLLDYDPTNPTYRAQLVALLNDAQQRVLVDRAWAFAQRERTIKVYADSTANITLTNGSATATGTFTVSRWPGAATPTANCGGLRTARPPTLTGPGRVRPPSTR